MLLVFFEDSTESAMYLCFAFLIRFLVLFLYFLYSDHSFRCLNLSRNLRASPISKQGDEKILPVYVLLGRVCPSIV